MKQINILLSHLILVSFVLSIFSFTFCQTEKSKPQRVLRLVYEIRPTAWYNEQAKLWKKEIERNPQNPQAWYNYYNANRYADYVETIDTETKQSRLKKIIEDMNKAIPGTYECYLLTYWNSHDPSDISLIKKAYEIDPNRPDTYYAFISHYEITGFPEKANEFYDKLYQSKDIAPSLIDYNYNVLQSTEKNAILFTNGDNDTYPVWMLQKSKNIRTDVTVLNIPMSPNNNFLESKLKNKGYSIDVKALKQKAFSGNSKKTGNFSVATYVQELCKTMDSQQPDIPIYFALTVNQHFINEIKDDLYIVGLAYQYSPKRIDNVAIVKKNIEKNLRLDYLKYNWYNENAPAQTFMPRMNMNYFAGMVMLAEHYHSSGEMNKAREWKNFALELAKKAGNQQAIEDLKKKSF